MKASELIRRLKEAKERYGDLPVKVSEWGYGESEVRDLMVWTAGGEAPDLRKRRTDPAVVIRLY